MLSSRRGRTLPVALGLASIVGLAACDGSEAEGAPDAAIARDAGAGDAAGEGSADAPGQGATVEGPITGPGTLFLDPLERGYPVKVADRGYVFEEYFVSGRAAEEPYRVRLLIARPDGPAAEPFSGHVLVEPKHATSIPFVWSFTREYLMARGHAAVEVTTFPSTVDLLRRTNAERYGELHVTDEQASDIFVQVGDLLKSTESPLPGARWLYMTGHSMASGPVWHFMDSHHEAHRLPDGGPIYDGFFPETTRTASRLGPMPDVDVPTILINSELEVEEVLVADRINYRKPDSDEPGSQFRLYA